MHIAETTAEILPSSRYVRSGGSLRLSCRVYLGEGGPDDDYRRGAVVHWFHGQRLLDPAVDSGFAAGSAAKGKKSRCGVVFLKNAAFLLGNVIEVGNLPPEY